MNMRTFNGRKLLKASSTANDYWNTGSQRRNHRQVTLLQKTEPVSDSAKNPRPKPAAGAMLLSSDVMKVFFIFYVDLRSV